jgi:hypothetical protein
MARRFGPLPVCDVCGRRATAVFMTEVDVVVSGPILRARPGCERHRTDNAYWAPLPSRSGTLERWLKEGGVIRGEETGGWPPPGPRWEREADRRPKS